MTFTTLTFLLFFVSVFLVYWALPGRRSRNWLIVLASYVFYGWWDYRFCFLILLSSLIDYGVGLALEKSSSGRARRLLLLSSLTLNLGLLGYFKYANFFIESAVDLAAALGWQTSPNRLAVILPVGISFYTFQTLSYTIDIYRRRLGPTRDLAAYLAYVSFFPQLVAGPIERATRLLPQFLQDRQFDAAAARDGLRQMLWGFVKKMVVADRLAVIVDAAYADPGAVSGAGLAFAAVCFSFQVYCDFSAYSDIAIGCARLFGIRLMRNFAYPFFSQSFREFWRHWHISLSTWLRDYVYVPLGGGRQSRLRVARNVMITFVLGGLWHGEGTNFLLWGALCGLIVAAEGFVGFRDDQPPDPAPGGNGWLPRPLTIARMAWAFGCFTMSLCIFRADSASQGVLVAAKIVSAVPDPLAVLIVVAQNPVASCMILALVAVEWIGRRREHPLQLGRFPRPLRWLVYTSLIWSTLAFAPERPQPFVYFQF